MRIVPSLEKVKTCPNCGSDELYLVKNLMTGRDYKHCVNCREEIFENETTCSEEKGPSQKENFIFEMREEISALDWCSHDAKTQMLVGNLQNILNKIIDYIEEN